MPNLNLSEEQVEQAKEKLAELEGILGDVSAEEFISSYGEKKEMEEEPSAALEIEVEAPEEEDKEEKEAKKQLLISTMKKKLA